MKNDETFDMIKKRKFDCQTFSFAEKSYTSSYSQNTFTSFKNQQ